MDGRPRSLRPSDLLAAFFTAGIACLVAGGAVALADALADWPAGRWLALHLLLVGGVSQLVLGAGQFFAGAFLATDPPPRWLIGVQLGSWNGGTALVAVRPGPAGRPAACSAPTWRSTSAAGSARRSSGRSTPSSPR